MLCPFKKETKFYADGVRFSSYRADLAREAFCECEGRKCMAYGTDPTDGSPICKLVEFRENKN